MIEFPKLKDAPDFRPPDAPPPLTLSPDTWPIWLWIMVLLAIAILGYVLYRIFKTQPVIALPAPPLASHVMAMTLLEDLRPQADDLPPQELAARVTEVVRTYLHRQFGILARYRTTQEILAQRRDPNTPPPAPAIKAFEDFLLHADTLNYGKSEERGQALIDEAINTIRKSNEHLANSVQMSKAAPEAPPLPSVPVTEAPENPAEPEAEFPVIKS